MPQEKYYKLSHFVPDGHPKVYPGMSSEVRAMMPHLIETSSQGWTKVPNHEDLETFATLKMEVPVLGFKKTGTEVYLHVFCNEFINPIYPRFP